MISTLSLGLQALSSRQAKWVLAFVLVAVVALLAVAVAGPHLVSFAHNFSTGFQPHVVCGSMDGPCS